jgi:hypothetical protein
VDKKIKSEVRCIGNFEKIKSVKNFVKENYAILAG